MNWTSPKPRRPLRSGALTVLILLLGTTAMAQQAPAPPPVDPEHRALPIHSTLYQLDERVEANRLAPAEAAEAARGLGLAVESDGLVNVEILNQDGEVPINESVVTAFGGYVDATWQGRASAWIPPGQMIELARTLPTGFFLDKANLGQPDDEGPAMVGSDVYISGGANGSGRRIGILDGGYSSLTAAVNAGNGPASSTRVNYAGGTFESGGTHGTRCVEEAFDHAPGAAYTIYKVGNLTHVGNAVNHAVSTGVDVLSMSLSWYNTGWGDNSGAACSAWSTASANGLLAFNSAGNRAQQHWEDTGFVSTDGDGWYDFVPGDETINITLPPGGGGNFYLSWNTAGGVNYDLYLYDSSLATVLASSTSGGTTYESFGYTNSTGSTQTVHLSVFRVGSGSAAFEAFMHASGSGGTWERATEAGSITSPSNCTYSNAISVAAVDEDDFMAAAGSNVIQGYSSRGPTNSGNQAPDISGPTNTRITGGGTFGGTSSATPNAAGAATAFWSSAPGLGASGVRHLLFEQADIFKDWGTNGTDYVYGHGGIALHEYAPNTVWVDRDANNVLNFSTLPRYTATAAYNAAVNGGRIVFLGDSYDESLTMTKRLLLESVGSTATIGN